MAKPYGKKIAATIKSKFGPDFYSQIGSMGGKTVTDKTKLKGFGSNKDLAKSAGEKGKETQRNAKKKVKPN